MHAAPREQAGGDEVDDQPASGHRQHPAPFDFGWLPPALHRLRDHPHRGDAEEDRVGEGRERLRPPRAVGAPVRARAAGDALRDEGEGEGAGVGQHVAGVGEQREAVGEEAAGDGGAHREERQDERGPDAALGGPRHSVVVRLGRSRFAFPLHPPRLVIMTEKPCHHLLRHGCL